MSKYMVVTFEMEEVKKPLHPDTVVKLRIRKDKFGREMLDREDVTFENFELPKGTLYSIMEINEA